jgi:protease I
VLRLFWWLRLPFSTHTTCNTTIMSLFGSDKLKGKKIAIVATDGFEQVELTKPKKYLEDEGAEVDVISLKSGSIK